MRCPHCGASNPGGGAFCESCGKALPTLSPSGPRIVAGNQFATTTVGQELQADALHKKAKKAAGALLAVAIIQTVVTGILVAVVYNTRARAEINYAVVVGMAIVAIVFWGLWLWSRKQPLPAAIAGLALYGTLVAINVITSVSQLAQQGAGAPRSGPFGGIGIGWLDIVIIAVLAQGITAGAQHRKLMQQQAGGPRPL
jgi:hypothetical protein